MNLSKKEAALIIEIVKVCLIKIIHESKNS